MSQSARNRKKLQRQREKAEGWKNIELKINPVFEEQVRNFVAMLPPPNKVSAIDQDQYDLIDYIDMQVKGEAAVDKKAQRDALRRKYLGDS